MSYLIGISFLIVLSGALTAVGAYAAYNDLKLAAVALVVSGWIIAAVAAAAGIDFGRVQGLVNSGKYEIATNEDYSLTELKTFKKVSGFYLKEVE